MTLFKFINTEGHVVVLGDNKDLFSGTQGAPVVFTER